jgi:hypothetical protein
MNTNNELNMIESHFAVEFSTMSNKEIYAWLRASFPTEKFLTGRTKAQLYRDAYMIAKEQLEAKEDKECDEMQANDTPAPAQEPEDDAESVADDVSIPADMFEEPEDDESVTGSDIFGDEQSDDEDDTPVATLIANKVAAKVAASMPEEQVYGLAYATIAKLQAEVAELKLQLQDAKDDIKDMVAGLKGIITNQQSRETFAALPAYEPKPRTTTTAKPAPKPKAKKAPAPVVEQPEGRRYTYKRPITYEGDYCKEGMVVEMSIKRLWVEGVAMRLAYYPSPEGNWLGLNAQWRGRRFLNLQRASTECCEKNQIANSPNAWAAFRCINPEDDEYISIERLDKHPNWADCKVLMDDQYWDEEGNLVEEDSDDEDA